MYQTRSEYDRGVNTFSPEGRWGYRYKILISLFSSYSHFIIEPSYFISVFLYHEIVWCRFTLHHSLFEFNYKLRIEWSNWHFPSISIILYIPYRCLPSLLPLPCFHHNNLKSLAYCSYTFTYFIFPSSFIITDCSK